MIFPSIDTVGADIAVPGGDITSTATTFNLLNTGVTTLNIGGAATTVSIGTGAASTLNANFTTQINLNTAAIVSSQTTVALLNTTTTTVNAFGAATAISIGAATGTLTLNNPAVNFALAATVPTLYGSAAANGDLTLEGTSHATKTTSYVILQPTGGNVVVGGTTGTAQRLVVIGPTSEPSLVFDSVAVARFAGSENSALAISSSASSPYGISLQVKHTVIDGLSYPLSLNPLGGNVGIGVTNPATLLELGNVTTITGAVTDGYSAALTLDPGYTGGFTVTRHNFFDIQNPSVAASAVITDACVFRFDANLGTHLATTNTDKTANAKSGTIKVNVNGTLFHIQLYAD